MKRYNPAEIEPKWQKNWEDQGTYTATENTSKPKRYVLEYFPYPSGAAMHVGHVRNYTIGDAIARFYRMKGYNVMHPMGWDAFGLPAENYAIKHNVTPQQAIAENTTKFRQQLMQMGFSYDWSREINSSDPKYYKWTQWFFKLLFERGLAYQKDSLQWWCETDKTVLANEQVENGKCWRCGNIVIKKPLKQWFFKITDYADRLEADLEKLDWSEAIKSMQRNWIGRKMGIDITYKITNANRSEEIVCFTTHPDTNFGATFVVVAPEHPLVRQIITKEITLAEGAGHAGQVANYKRQSLAKSEIERQEEGRKKTGVFTGLYALNTLTGHEMPIWVSDFVLAGFGTGAVVGVPAHDKRDYQFAKAFDIPIIEVVEPVTGTPQENPEFRRSIVAVVRNPHTNEFLSVNWGKLGGNLFIGGGRDKNEDIAACAEREIAEETGYKHLKLINQTGRIHHHYFAHSKNVARRIEAHGLLFDLVDETKQDISLEADEQGKFAVEWLGQNEVESKVTDELHALVYDLLVKENCYTGEGVMVNSGKYDGSTTSETREKIAEDLVNAGAAQWRTNYKIRDWLISRQRYWGAPIPIVHCEKDGVVAVPDDQLPIELPEVKSYQPTGEGTSVLASVVDWVNTTCPTCGGPAKRETDTMDGFACSSWYFLRFTDPHNDEKPFDPGKAKFWLPVDDYIGGAEHAIMHLLYARMWTKVMFDAGLIEFDEPFTALRNHGMILAPDGRKMSKSWGNVIAPDNLIADGYGADAVRIMELFIGPWNQQANWSVEGLGGCYRFLQRAWTLQQEYLEAGIGGNDEGNKATAITAAAHKATKRVTEDVHRLGFNTAIAALMEYINELYKHKAAHGFTAKAAWQDALERLALLLAPFAPHITEELWQQLGHQGSIHLARWPSWDEALLAQDIITIAVQVNGKLRSELTMPKESSEEDVKAAALADEKIAAYTGSNELKRIVYIPGKIINIVV